MHHPHRSPHQQPTGESSRDISSDVAEKEASKAQRMLSSAGLRVAPPSPQAMPPSSALLGQQHLQDALAGASAGKRRGQRGVIRGGTARGPPRFTVFRFLSAEPEQGGLEGGEGQGEVGAEGACSFGRGDLVEFSVVARKGQRQQQQSQRVEGVTLFLKDGLPCR